MAPSVPHPGCPGSEDPHLERLRLRGAWRVAPLEELLDLLALAAPFGERGAGDQGVAAGALLAAHRPAGDHRGELSCCLEHGPSFAATGDASDARGGRLRARQRRVTAV